MTERTAHFMQRPLTRAEYLQVVRTGLVARQFTFARQAVLNWLGTYPGDLQAALYYAQALAGEQRPALAARILQGLCAADPEYFEAVDAYSEVLAQLKVMPDRVSVNDGSQTPSSNSIDPLDQIGVLENLVEAHKFALRGGDQEGEISASWGAQVWLARKAIEQNDLTIANQLIDEVIIQESPHPLVGVVHLQLLESTPDLSWQEKLTIARRYHERWPDTIEIMLRLADILIEVDQSDLAVALLHQAAARDIEGQVFDRIWGCSHAYRSLWPENLRLRMSIMVPAIVQAMLGWNRLPQGSLKKTEPAQAPVGLGEFATNGAIIEKELTIASLPVGSIDLQVEAAQPVLSSAQPARIPNRSSEKETIKTEASKPLARKEINTIAQELEQLAIRFKIPGVMGRDGRFPIYVLFSIRSRLRAVYGLELAQIIESEMEQLAAAVQRRPGWGARVMFADDPVCTVPNGSKPAKPDDPWALKLVVADLDRALAKQGERIGALMIVGGPEIVPFHLLPNPVDDSDPDIASDNPYATRDKNYFIPEWAVGRLPGGAGGDASLLLSALRRFTKEHKNLQRKLPWRTKLGNWVSSLKQVIPPSNQTSFGYTAEIWRQASENVFRLIGRPAAMHVSPPCGLTIDNNEGVAQNMASLEGVPAPLGKLAYFNLHGLIDAPEWFGHRDLLAGSEGPDFPVALRPVDITNGEKKGQAPSVVFSEACYGMHIQNRSIEEAISLKFLEAGSQAVVGSTCMAYGAVATTPMVAADFLGFTFWRFLKQGMPAGEALRQAKIYLAYEMQNRQGYLDGEDQKTAISFILYGDPLAEPIHRERAPKSIRYLSKSIGEVRIVCDRGDSPQDAGPVPAEVMHGVQKAVAKYLPGMKDARLEYVCEHTPHSEGGSTAPSAEPWSEASMNQVLTGKIRGKDVEKPFRRLVMLSKQVARHGEIHPVIARLTLDDHGKLVKLVVSR